MKTLNTIFVGVYSVVLMATVYFVIYWIVTRGAGSMFDDFTEFILAVLYLVVVIYSIWMHWKLRTNFSVASKICATVTSINVISLAGLVFTAINSNNGDDGLFLAAWAFSLLILWFISLVSGVTALRG